MSFTAAFADRSTPRGHRSTTEMDAGKIAETMRRCDEALVTARRALERKERECDGLRLELASARAALEESRANAAVNDIQTSL